ncbi:MAG: twin-arginine translocation pathway signal, partial [Phaeodactylibacter sp.]|nr:twin-arginine translocation pathway signal [Phaeodactylibacter sp.]
DHGTANNVVLIGGSLPKPGFFNAPPDLSDLDEGDLKYQIDFRQIYQNVLSEVLGANPEHILGRKFDVLKAV